MSGLLDSNQRPRAPQTCALPTAPNPELASAKIDKRDDTTKFMGNFLRRVDSTTKSEEESMDKQATAPTG